MPRSIKRTTLLLAAGALLLAACGEATPQATTDLQVTGSDGLEFEPAAFTVPAGTEVTVEFTSEPTVDHDLAVADAAEHGMAGDEGHGSHADDDHAMASGDLHLAQARDGTDTIRGLDTGFRQAGGEPRPCRAPSFSATVRVGREGGGRARTRPPSSSGHGSRQGLAG